MTTCSEKTPERPKNIKQNLIILATFIVGFAMMIFPYQVFAQELNVYGRAGERCHACGSVIKEARLANRTTGYCPQCQS